MPLPLCADFSGRCMFYLVFGAAGVVRLALVRWFACLVCVGCFWQETNSSSLLGHAGARPNIDTMIVPESTVLRRFLIHSERMVLSVAKPRFVGPLPEKKAMRTAHMGFEL